MDQSHATGPAATPPLSRVRAGLDSWPVHLVTAVVTGVATTRMPMQRWSRPAQWAVHGGMGVVAAAAAAVVARHPDGLREEGEEPPFPPLGIVPTVAVAGLLGLAVAGLSRGGQAADSRAEAWLATRDVRRPRVWMGIAAAAGSLAMSAADRRRAARVVTPPTGRAEPGSALDGPAGRG